MDWNRLDLHQHTDHDIDCKGKHVKSNYTHTAYYDLLKEEKVKLKAVTCHNNINIASHVKHAIIADLLGINHLVGVEIDYRFDKLEFHAITILSPNVNIINFANTLKEIRKEKNNQIYFSKDDFAKLHKNIEFIFIPHAIKDKGILESKIGSLEKNTLDWVVSALISGIGMPIIFENTKDYYIYTVAEKIRKTLNLENVDIEFPCYVGDDYKFDNDQIRKDKILNKVKYAINSSPTYRGLEIAIRNWKTRLSIESQIIHRKNFIKEIQIPNNNVFEHSILNFSPGLNVIIGNSGSGKTLLLNEIYYELTDNNLSAAMKSEKTKLKENQYKNKVGNVPFLNIKFDNDNINKDDLKILEIPNVYSEILKSQNDNDIPAMFGINDTTNSNKIINNYKGIISDYLNNYENETIANENGRQNINNIQTAINFLMQNKLDSKKYIIEKHNFSEEKLNDIDKKINTIQNYIDDKEKNLEYLSKLREILTIASSINHFELLQKNYLLLVDDLKKEKDKLLKAKEKLLIDNKIDKIINNSIDKITSVLGLKEKKVIERKEIIERENNRLVNNIKSTLRCEIKNENINLAFPYELLKNELETNKNEYARLTLNINKDDLYNANILNLQLFDLTNMKTKIKDLDLECFNFFDSDSVKKVAKELFNNKLNLGNIIKNADEIPKNIELYLSDQNEWRLIQNINQGDIAKKSIEFYFNKLIKDNQPDIILIDQPENDVDKTFISNTLSNFILTQKLDKQIIITTHEAIIAINSDANKIIQANVTNNNKIKYESYNLEDVDGIKKIATDKVSTILDGGKENIKLRYQIYGGELNYENKNL